MRIQLDKTCDASSIVLAINVSCLHCYSYQFTHWAPLHASSHPLIQLWLQPLLQWPALPHCHWMMHISPAWCISCFLYQSFSNAVVCVQNMMSAHMCATQKCKGVNACGATVINGGWKPVDNGFLLHLWAHCSETHIIHLLKRSWQDQVSLAYSDGQVKNTWPNHICPPPLLSPGITSQINYLPISLCLSWALGRTWARN